MSDPPERIQLFDRDWAGGEDALVWLTMYSAVARRPQDVTEQAWVTQLGNARIGFLYGTFEFLDTTGPQLVAADRLELRYEPNLKKLPDGLYFLTAQPFGTEAQPGSEVEARATASELAGLAGAIFGPNAIFRKVVENVIHLADNRRSLYPPFVRNPLAWRPARVGLAQLDEMTKGFGSLRRLPERQQNRVRLALHWFERSIAAEGLDGFIHLWVALEALGMSERENVRPLHESLGRAYGLTHEAARSRFELGRVFDFRSKIVHHGQRPALNGGLVDYLECIFVDVLHERLGLENPRLAGQAQTSPEWNLRQWLGHGA